jgi:hypothetical protein
MRLNVKRVLKAPERRVAAEADVNSLRADQDDTVERGTERQLPLYFIMIVILFNW